MISIVRQFSSVGIPYDDNVHGNEAWNIKPKLFSCTVFLEDSVLECKKALGAMG